MSTKEKTQEVKSLGKLGDIPVQITVEIGRSTLTVNELSSLSKGSVVSLDSEPGDLFNIQANGKLIGRGEVVVVNNKFGIRLAEVLL